MMNASSRPMRISFLQVICMLVILPVLSGCSGAQDLLGLSKESPDEFSVLARAPLSVPPEFGLRPPAPGATRPQETGTRDSARQLLTNAEKTGADRETAGIAALKQQLGTDAADPEIRSIISREGATVVLADQTLIERLLGADPILLDDQVDASREAERLEENAESGKSASEGETPVIKRSNRGLLDRLF